MMSLPGLPYVTLFLQLNPRHFTEGNFLRISAFTFSNVCKMSLLMSEKFSENRSLAKHYQIITKYLN